MADDEIVTSEEVVEVKKRSKARQKRHRDKIQSAVSTIDGTADESQTTTEFADHASSHLETSLQSQIQAFDIEKMREQKEEVGNLTSVPGPSKNKRKKRRKKATAEYGTDLYPAGTILGDVGHHLREDIVEMDAETNLEITPKSDHVWHTVVSSQAPGKVFVESNGAFKGFDKQKQSNLKKDLKSASAPSPRKTAPSAIWYGLSVRGKAERFATCCQGILAGFALWQAVVVYCLGPPNFALDDFAEHYSPFAGAVSSIFYLLLTICVVSLMGRCGICLSDDSWSVLQRPYCALLALVVYVSTLILSLSIADLDDQLALFSANVTEELEPVIGQWRNVNLCRCLGAILGWLVLCSCPAYDRFVTHLKGLIN